MAMLTTVVSTHQPRLILSISEYMNSLEESSMEEVKQAIRSVPWLDDYFDIGEKYN